jgi:hypothetical protein
MTLKEQIAEKLAIVEGNNSYPLEDSEKKCTDSILSQVKEKIKGMGLPKEIEGAILRELEK